ncbi:MAG: hypothetical protein HYS81_00765 [Candidatus Aenigmatarchaeota archaeon]|nr:MAG: hypothetical protein HYS81_00765 [Candidatus Aenigmarchaeota archaeon]
MAALKYIIIAGLLGAALAVAGFAAATGGFEREAERSALIAAFPITERITSGVNLMLSQEETGFIEVALPPIRCEIAFNEPYVETTVRRGDISQSYGLFVFGGVNLNVNPIECPTEAELKDGKKVRVNITRIDVGGPVFVKRVVLEGTVL